MKSIKSVILIAASCSIISAKAQLVYQNMPAQATPTQPVAAAKPVAKPKKKWQPKTKWYPGCCGTKKWQPKTTVTTTTTVQTLPSYKSVLIKQNYTPQPIMPMAQQPVQALPPKQESGENIFPLNGNAGIGTNSPNSALEIKRSAGDGDNKNFLLTLTNVWSPNGLNEPSIMFSNGDVNQALSYWTVGARISGDNAHPNLPQSFKIGFKPQEQAAEREYFAIDGFSGNVRIGNCNSNMQGYKLFVEEGILTEKVKVAVKNSDEWFDTVFEPEYKVMPIKDLETYININKHLPEIPTTKEVMANGVDLGKMNGLLLKKVEELTLYMIDMKKQLDEAKKEIEELKKVH